MGILSSVLSAATSSAGDFLGSMWQNTQNKKAATRAYEREIELWNMNNEYNTPTAQVQRLKDAGLNPALIYGTGSSVATGVSKGAASAPQTAAARGPRLDLLSAASLGQDIRMKQAQTANIEKQNEVISQRIKNMQTEGDIRKHNLLYAVTHNQPVGQGEDRSMTGRFLNWLRGNDAASRAKYDADYRHDVYDPVGSIDWIDVPVVSK